jgi:hypothetical protein
MFNHKDSPYKDKNSVTLEEFLWAFSIASSRHVVFNNEQTNNDPNMLLILMPLLDYINHSFNPNVVIKPF